MRFNDIDVLIYCESIQEEVLKPIVKTGGTVPALGILHSKRVFRPNNKC